MYSYDSSWIMDVDVIKHVAQPAGTPYVEKPDAMPPEKVANVIGRMSPALRIAPILAATLGLRKGEICGLRVGSLWLPTRDDRSAMEWYLAQFETPLDRRRAARKYATVFDGAVSRHGLIHIAGQRTAVHDPRTGQPSVRWIPVLKTDASRRLLGVTKALRAYLKWYLEEFLGDFDPGAPTYPNQLLVRSMKIDAHGRYQVPPVHQVSGAVKYAMAQEGYDFKSTGYGCGLHLLRKSLAGWLEASNRLSGRMISEQLGHRVRVNTDAPDEGASPVTGNFYLTPVRRTQILRTTKVTNRILKRAFGSFERFQEAPRRCGEAFVVGEEVAQRFGYHLSTVDWMAREGILRAEKSWVAGYAERRWLFDRSSIDEYEERRSPQALAPAGTLSTVEAASALSVSIGQITLLVRQGRLTAHRTAAGFRIPKDALQDYRDAYRPEGTVSVGEALERINEVIPMTAKQLHQLCVRGVITAHRRPKGKAGFWLRPYVASVEAYLERAVVSLDAERTRRRCRRTAQAGAGETAEDLAS